MEQQDKSIEGAGRGAKGAVTKLSMFGLLEKNFAFKFN